MINNKQIRVTNIEELQKHVNNMSSDYCSFYIDGNITFEGSCKKGDDVYNEIFEVICQNVECGWIKPCIREQFLNANKLWNEYISWRKLHR